MDEFKALIDYLYLEEVTRARQKTLGERLSTVFELCDWNMGTNDPEVKRRVELVRSFEERDCYGPPRPRL